MRTSLSEESKKEVVARLSEGQSANLHEGIRANPVCVSPSILFMAALISSRRTRRSASACSALRALDEYGPDAFTFAKALAAARRGEPAARRA